MSVKQEVEFFNEFSEGRLNQMIADYNEKGYTVTQVVITKTGVFWGVDGYSGCLLVTREGVD